MAPVLDKIAQELPKALIGLLVPLVQLAWRRYSASKVQSKKIFLRQSLAYLSDQRKALAPVSELPDGQHALQDIDSEIAAGLSELAALSHASHRVRKPSERPAVVRWLLLYTPSGIASWIFHSLYFLGVALIFWAIIYVIQDWKYEENPGFLCVLSALPAIIFRNMAAWIDGGRFWVAAVIFWIAAGFFAFMWMLFFWDSGKEARDYAWAIFLPTLVLLAICVTAFASSKLPPPKLTSITKRPNSLLFVPSRPLGWFSMAALYGAIPLMVYQVVNDIHTYKGFVMLMINLAIDWLFSWGYIMCALRWAQSFNPAFDLRKHSHFHRTTEL